MKLPQLVLLSCVLAGALFSTARVPVFAADKAKKETVSPEDAKKVAAEKTPITEWINAENAMIDSLPFENRKVFFVLREKYGVIRSIAMVKRDIGNAVTACGKENADMKKPMKARFKQWENAVDPIIKEANKFLETELKEQEAFYVSDYRHVMKLNDKAYEFSESKIEKTPVTTKEACEGLLASMDKTEDTMVSLLQDILLPEEVVRERIERAKEAEEKAKEKSEKK